MLPLFVVIFCLFIFILLSEVSNARTNEHELYPSGSDSLKETCTNPAETSSAVINFKSSASQSVPDYERVTHSHLERQNDQSHHLVPQSVDRAVNASNVSPLIAPNSVDSRASVYSGNDQHNQLPHHKLLAHVEKHDIAVGVADLRSRSSNSTGEEQDLHCDTIAAGKSTTHRSDKQQHHWSKR